MFVVGHGQFILKHLDALGKAGNAQQRHSRLEDHQDLKKHKENGALATFRYNTKAGNKVSSTKVQKLYEGPLNLQRSKENKALADIIAKDWMDSAETEESKNYFEAMDRRAYFDRLEVQAEKNPTQKNAQPQNSRLDRMEDKQKKQFMDIASMRRDGDRLEEGMLKCFETLGEELGKDKEKTEDGECPSRPK